MRRFENSNMSTATAKKRFLTVKRGAVPPGEEHPRRIAQSVRRRTGDFARAGADPAAPAAAPALSGHLWKKVPAGAGRNRSGDAAVGLPVNQRAVHRGVKPQYRPIPAGTPQFLCPCDGTVQDIGRIEPGRALTLKGIHYTIASLAPGTDIRQFEGGHFAVFSSLPSTATGSSARRTVCWKKSRTCPATACWSIRRTRPPSTRSTRSTSG